MSKKWYPVVDVISCIECGTCVNNCPHSVYDKSKAPSSVVVNPDCCVDYCHYCGDNCPVGAITYVGDNTGWIPPILREKGGMQDVSPNCGCSCSCGGNGE